MQYTRGIPQPVRCCFPQDLTALRWPFKSTIDISPFHLWGPGCPYLSTMLFIAAWTILLKQAWFIMFQQLWTRLLDMSKVLRYEQVVALCLSNTVGLTSLFKRYINIVQRLLSQQCSILWYFFAIMLHKRSAAATLRSTYTGRDSATRCDFSVFQSK